MGDASTMMKRQNVIQPAPATSEQQRSSSSSSSINLASMNGRSYNHKWLLFLIPLILIFFGLVALIWWMVRRRKKQRQRRSVLRNRTLVIAEKEREKEREERRLSRGNSVASKMSRMTSLRSGTTTRTNSQSGIGRNGPRRGAPRSGHGHEGQASGSTQSHSTEMGGVGYASQLGHQEDALDEKEVIEDEKEDVDAKDDIDPNRDIEREAESEIVMASDAAPAAAEVLLPSTEQDSNGPGVPARVRIVESSAARGVDRKELSSIGEGNGSEGVEDVVDGDGAAAAALSRNDSKRSQKSILSPSNSSEPSSAITPSSSSTSKNPFASPPGSSNGHSTQLGRPTSPITTNAMTSTDSKGSNLSRTLSGVIRVRQPSPALQRPTKASVSSTSLNVQRSDSRASRKSSLRSVLGRGNGATSPSSTAAAAGPGAGAGTSGSTSTNSIAGSWAYTSKASQWKNSSTEGTTPSISYTTADTAAPASEQGHSIISQDNNYNSNNLEVGSAVDETSHETARSARTPSPLPLGRKPSIGVAGSRFVESFD